MKFWNEIKGEIVKGLVEGIITGIMIAALIFSFFKFCYHLDGQHYTLGGNYVVLEERITDFFGNDIIAWERKIPKQPGEIVIYEKRF